MTLLAYHFSTVCVQYSSFILLYCSLRWYLLMLMSGRRGWTHFISGNFDAAWSTAWRAHLSDVRLLRMLKATRSNVVYCEYSSAYISTDDNVLLHSSPPLPQLCLKFWTVFYSHLPCLKIWLYCMWCIFSVYAFVSAALVFIKILMVGIFFSQKKISQTPNNHSTILAFQPYSNCASRESYRIEGNRSLSNVNYFSRSPFLCSPVETMRRECRQTCTYVHTYTHI